MKETPIYNQMIDEGLSWPGGPVKYIDRADFERILDKQMKRWSGLCDRLKASGD